ncbi:NEDD8-activating enzyme E1 regulatory subunit [Rhizophlyctis rosea]|uniref:NEDD8-activating enzyme E1 regulatory subunit n=1 Tax=Rhizophlyctis rosea TaxID=64517 RepID=A0AAD5SKT9_9FUNG|nr:NEDD8-activating enzyme E1 regulatory subunit [Rhizophlyctis rosea]
MDKKTQKYDRQLRLWGGHGQEALGASKVCLINGSAVGTETLKNLILPAIGSFTVVDDKPVSGSDAGNNFFLTQDSIDQPRAKCVTELLRELNEEVEGNHVEQNPTDIMANNPEFFHQFNLVITTQLPESIVLPLAEICWNANIPLFVVRVNGFFGYFRIALPEHTIVEPHPEQLLDLRLDCPFPALIEYANKFDFESTDTLALSHIPYIAILLRCLQEHKRTHGGAVPSLSELRQLIRQLQSKDLSDPENFDEAHNSAFKARQQTTIPRAIEQILNDPKAEDITNTSSDFWILARAVRDFVANEGNGLLPLAGTVPDMKSDTESFVVLQTIYKTKAKEDVQSVQRRVSQLLTSVGKSADSIPQGYVDAFCKYSAHLRVIRYRSLREEYEKPLGQYIASKLADLDDNIVYYVLHRAVDRFFETHKRYPGYHNHEVETDVGLLKKCVTSLLSEWQVSASTPLDDHLHEIVRAGASELHSVSSLLGGIVSQEAIKVLTRQYVPMDNTVVVNTVRSTSSVYTL